MNKPSLMEPRLGGALIAIADPWAGHEQSFNRWYEDDHFYTGASAGPGCVSARRFVSPSRLRHPTGVDAAYLSLYWLLPGLIQEFRDWASTTIGSMQPAGRMFAERDMIYVSFARLVSERLIDPEPMTPLHALDHPYNGLVIEVLDLAAPEDVALAWIEAKIMPLEDEANVGQVLAFVPDDPTESRHVAILWFLRSMPTEGWFDAFRNHRTLTAESGIAHQRFVTAHVPTVPGTDTYLSEIR